MWRDVGRSSLAPSSVPGGEGRAFHVTWGSVHLRPHKDLVSASKSVLREGGRALPRVAWPVSGSWVTVHPSDTFCLSVSFNVVNVTKQPAWWADCLRAVAKGPAAFSAARDSQQQVSSHTQPFSAAAGCHPGGRWARLRVLSVTSHP